MCSILSPAFLAGLSFTMSHPQPPQEQPRHPATATGARASSSCQVGHFYPAGAFCSRGQGSEHKEIT
jgi:hypothetical protein